MGSVNHFVNTSLQHHYNILTYHQFDKLLVVLVIKKTATIIFIE